METVFHKEEPEMSLLSENITTASAETLKNNNKVIPAAHGVKLYRLVVVALGLICVVQTALNISMGLVLYHKAGNKTPTEQIDEMKSSLEICSKNLTGARNELRRKLDECENLENNNKNLTEERDELQKVNIDLKKNNKNLTDERNELKRTLDHLVYYMERNWLYSSGSFYYVSTTKATWEDSRTDCRNRNADLVIINSKEEEEFTRKLQKRLWIGLSDQQSEGHWKWVDGTPLTTSYWSPGEPNQDRGINEDCAEIWKFNTEQSWNDVPCTTYNYWICEKTFGA